MIRPVLTEIGVFLIPFMAYAVFLVATRAGVIEPTSWPLPRIVVLASIGVVLMIASLLVLVHFSGAPPGSTYTPAHVENGVLIPGREQ